MIRRLMLLATIGVLACSSAMPATAAIQVTGDQTSFDAGETVIKHSISLPTGYLPSFNEDGVTFSGPIFSYGSSFIVGEGSLTVTTNASKLGLLAFANFPVGYQSGSSSGLIGSFFVTPSPTPGGPPTYCNTCTSLTFIGVDNGSAGPFSITLNPIENVSIYGFQTFGPAITAPAPEPATWGMMILGVCAIGFVARHRRRAHTTVSFA